MHARPGARAAGGQDGAGGRDRTQPERPGVHDGLYVADDEAEQGARGESLSAPRAPRLCKSCARVLEKTRRQG